MKEQERITAEWERRKGGSAPQKWASKTKTSKVSPSMSSSLLTWLRSIFSRKRNAR